MALFRSFKRTPTLLQMETAECGAASLGIILAHYGKHLPLEVLRRECGVNRDGSKASNIMKAARRLGLDATGVRVDAEEIQKRPVPAIIHWEFNHFLVLEGFRKGRAYLNDPGFGHRSVGMNDFRSSFTGIAMLLKPGPDFVKGGRPFSAARTIAAKLMRDKPALAFVAAATLLLVLPGLAAPVFSQVFLDDVLSGRHADWLKPLLFIMLVFCGLGATLTGLRAGCLTRWQTKLTIKDSAEFFWHIIRLPMTFFQQRFSGEIAMRVHFNESIADILTGHAATVVLDLLVAMFFLVLLVNYSLWLTIIGVVFSLLDFLILTLARRRLVELSMRIQQDAGKALGAAIGGLQAIETIKANNNENDFFAKWAGFQAKRTEGMQRLDLEMQILSSGPAVLAAVNASLLMAIGGFQIMDGLMTAGIFMAFRGLMDNFQAPMQSIFGVGQMVQGAESQMRRLADVFNYEAASDSGTKPSSGSESGEGHLHRLDGEVELRDIDFGYSPLDSSLITGLNLTLKPGRWVALVGNSGSGKSTVSRIVNGLYRQWTGEVLFDGQPREAYPKAVLANSIASVSQEIYLFNGSVRENLALFDPSIPDADILRAAGDAVIHDDVAKMEGGYDHRLAEGGANLSGGQRQRIEIARALVTNPSVLILDEATSALDPITEEKVLANIRRRGCSCLIVAHRLSAFRDCDEIIVLDWGTVAERGTHAQMIQQDGPYRRLIGSQLDAEEQGT